jgi:hypothetical protein
MRNIFFMFLTTSCFAQQSMNIAMDCLQSPCHLASTTVSDNSAAFNDAMRYSQSTRRCVTVPDGTYQLAQPVLGGASCLLGNSWTLKYTGPVTTNPVLTISYGYAGRLTGATIDGQGNAPIAVRVTNTTIGFVMENIHAINVSEGNGIGINCIGIPGTTRCAYNSFHGIDTENNAIADYVIGPAAFGNTLYTPNSSSAVGVHFVASADGSFNSARSNTVIGGHVGNSLADAGTRENRFIGVSSDINVLAAIPFTDNGANASDSIFNQATSTLFQGFNHLLTATPVQILSTPQSSGIACRKSDSTLGTCLRGPVCVCQ